MNGRLTRPGTSELEGVTYLSITSKVSRGKLTFCLLLTPG